MNMVMTAYNLMSLFRQAALRSTVSKVQPKQIQHTLNTPQVQALCQGRLHQQGGKEKLPEPGDGCPAKKLV